MNTFELTVIYVILCLSFILGTSIRLTYKSISGLPPYWLWLERFVFYTAMLILASDIADFIKQT